MLFLIYCDTDTLDGCNSNKLNEMIKEYATYSMQVTKQLWFAEMQKQDYSSFLDVDEDFYNKYISQYATEDSIFCMTKITRKDTFLYSPDVVHDFIDCFGTEK